MLNVSMFRITKELPVVVFVIFGSIIGLVFINSKGPFAGPDMYDAHYKTALAVATGQSFANEKDGTRRVLVGDEDYFRSGGGKCVDITIVATQLLEPLDSDDQDVCIASYDEKLSSNNVSTKAIVAYPPMGYLPQAAGLFIGIHSGMEPIHGQTLARILNLLVYILLVALSIKLVPFGKWLLVILGLLPTSLFLASSMSPDSLNIAWSIIFIAYVIRLHQRGALMSKKQIGVVAVLGYGLFMLKVAYVPLIILILGLSGQVLRRPLRWLLVTAIALFGSITYLIWSKYLGSVVSSVDIGLNLNAILHNIPAAISGVMVNILFTPYRIFETNQSIYVLLTVLVGWVIVSQVKTIKRVPINDTFDFFEKHKMQVLGVIAAAGSLGITYVALLVTWTDVTEYGFFDIQGFQGRYTLPLLPLLLLAYYLPQKTKSKAVNARRSKANTTTKKTRTGRISK